MSEDLLPDQSAAIPAFTLAKMQGSAAIQLPSMPRSPAIACRPHCPPARSPPLGHYTIKIISVWFSSVVECVLSEVIQVNISCQYFGKCLECRLLGTGPGTLRDRREPSGGLRRGARRAIFWLRVSPERAAPKSSNCSDMAFICVITAFQHLTPKIRNCRKLLRWKK